MTRVFKPMAALTVAFAAVFFISFALDGVSVAHAASLTGPLHAAAGSLDLPHLAAAAAAVSVSAVDLDTLRALHGDVVRRAQAKLAEAKDGMPQADVARIEAEHASLVSQAETLARTIAQATPPALAAAPVDAAIAAERTRVGEINTLAMKHAKSLPAAFAAEHIGNGTPVEQVRALVLDHVAAAADRGAINNRGGAQGAEQRAAVSSAWDRALARAGAPL